MEVGRMNRIMEMAKDLGQALGRTDEYQALNRAATAVNDDRDLTALQTELQKLESDMVSDLQRGKEPEEASRERYEELARDLQARPEFQRLIAAQTNFDKLLQKVNETISQGIQEGARGRIILPS